MDEDFQNFIIESRAAFQKATGAIPDNDAVSRFALAYQMGILNENIETFLEAQGLIESESEEVENGREQ